VCSQAVKSRPTSQITQAVAALQSPLRIINSSGVNEHLFSDEAQDGPILMRRRANPFKFPTPKAIVSRILTRGISTAITPDAKTEQPTAKPTPPEPDLLRVALKIFDVDGCVELAALENYAKQLPRSELYKTSTISFAINDIELHYAAMPAFDFHSMINDVAEAISTELGTMRSLFSYTGNGVFIGLSEHGTPRAVSAIAQKINAEFAESEIDPESDQPFEIRVSAGEPVGMTWSSGASVTAALRQAVKQALAARKRDGELRDSFWFKELNA